MNEENGANNNTIGRASQVVREKLRAYIAERSCSMSEAARVLGVPKTTLFSYLRAGKTVIPKPEVVGRIAASVGFTEDDRQLIATAGGLKQKRATMSLRSVARPGQAPQKTTVNFDPAVTRAIDELADKTKESLAEARGYLTVLALISADYLRERAVQEIKEEAGLLWQMYQVARSLVPKEVLEEIWLSRNLSGSGRTRIQGGKSSDS